MHVFQFLEICVPWSLERWIWEFSIVVLQVWVGSPAGEAGSGHPPRRSHLGATHRWRSTVCSSSVLRRRWGGAAGSREGPGPAGRQGRLRLGSSPWRPSDPLRSPGLQAGPLWLPASPSSEAQVWLPIFSSRGRCRAEGGEPGATSPTSVINFQPAPELGFGLAALLQTRPRPGSCRAPREAS